MEVLQLLKTELSGPEIADRLTVSLNTVRYHTKNIYQKLQVTPAAPRSAAPRSWGCKHLHTSLRTTLFFHPETTSSCRDNLHDFFVSFAQNKFRSKDQKR